ncbi:MAG: heme biosynthesis protein HemY [Gammaproteobacteria bacterium]|nr:MAG: heme biosynthesis protein HemY [Gammaproteobacteria bacterium]
MKNVLKAFVFKPSTIVFLIFGVALIALFVLRHSSSPGYFLLALGEYTVETSFLVAAFLLFVFVLIVFWLLRLLEWLFDKNRGRNSARKKTTKGLIAYAEGNWPAAEKILAKSAARHDVPLINYITAAKAAHEQGHDDQRDDYLRLAHESTKGVDSAIGLAKARLQYDSQQWEQCLATLMMLKKEPKSPGYPNVLKMLAEVYVQLEDWENLRQVLPEIKKRKLLTKEQYLELAQQCYLGLIATGARSSYEMTPLQQVKQAWAEVPRGARHTPELVHAYCSRLVELDAGEEAEQVLVSFLKKHWDEQLVRLYGIVNGEDSEKQLLLAETWLKERPNDAILLLTLGRLSLKRHNWDSAQSYFRSSLSSRKTAEAFGELGRLTARMGQYEESSDYFQQGLAMISQGLPELPLPE